MFFRHRRGERRNQMSKKGFEYRGINHVALVCRDMAETADFYENVLEMPLVRAQGKIGRGQHFFFDCGNGATLGFMWFPGAPAAVPGVASQGYMDKTGPVSAIASMNHLAIDVPLERFDEFVQRLKDKGLDVHVINHNQGGRSSILQNPKPAHGSAPSISAIRTASP